MANRHNGFLPRGERDLLAWARHFYHIVETLDPDFRVPPEAVIELQVSIDGFEMGLAGVEPLIRSKSSTSRKMLRAIA